MPAQSLIPTIASSIYGRNEASALPQQGIPLSASSPGQGDTQVTQPMTFSPLQLSEERRVVTIMFADITGSTPLADRLDPEDMRAILTGYFNLMTEQIRKHGGTVEKYIGDAVMAVFGTPLSHEDDPDRALRAALDMQTALTRFNEQRLSRDPEATRLQMRIGINTGEVATPSNTSTDRQDFLITGDAVNIAARLQQVAAPETILVSERTYLSTRDVFQFKAVAPLALKGKRDPLNAYVVQGLRLRSATIGQHPRGFADKHAPLVGRTLELTLLHASYARVRAERRPHLITILGVPGVGKSRLVSEFIEREQERIKSASSTGEKAVPLVLKGRCPPYGEGTTYWPLIEIIRTLLHVQDEETNDALQERFVRFVRETLTRTGRSESPEEIAETLLRSIGSGLSGRITTTDRQDYTGRMLSGTENSGRNVKLKQSGVQGALLRAWRIVIEALGELQPLLIVVDDLQWADEALLDLLEYLADRITTAPILFLCPARPDFFEQRRDWGGGHRNFTTIELEALSWEESSELVDALLNTSDLPETLRYTILTRSEGNPFFVEEIIRMFIDQGMLVRREDQQGKEYWHWSASQQDTLLTDLNIAGEAETPLVERQYVLPLPHVPDTVQGVLAARVDLLNLTEKLVLQHAAIVGRIFWLSSLLELAIGMSLETVLEALAALIRRDFVIELEKQGTTPVNNDRTFSFKHILIRDVVYNNIPRQRRSREHARLALWLEEQTQDKRSTFLELLANHYQQALATWSPRSAVDVIEIELTNSPAQSAIRLTRGELRERAIQYLTQAGDHALQSYYTLRALRAYNDAYDLLLDGQADVLVRSKMLEKIGEAYTQRGNMDDAWQQYRKALRLRMEEQGANAEPQRDEERAYLLHLYEHLALLATRWNTRFDTSPDMQETLSYINAGLQLLAGKPISRESVAFLTYQAFWDIRQLAVVPAEQKIELAAQALASGQEALRQAEELNTPRILSLTLDAMSFIYEQYHQYRQARELHKRREQLESQLTDRDELYDLYFSLGRAYERIAEYQASLTFFGKAWNIAQTLESPAMLVNSMVGRMRTWQQWNRWDEARQVALEILQIVDRYQQDEKRQFWALETLAVLAYHQGKTEEGEDYERRCKRLLDQQAERLSSAQKYELDTRLHALHHARGDLQLATSNYKRKLEESEPFPSPEILSTLAELLVTMHAPLEEQMEVCERAVALGELSGACKSLAVALRVRGQMHLQQQQEKEAEHDLHASLQLCHDLDLPWESGHALYNLGLLYKYVSEQETDEDRSVSIMNRARYYFGQARGFYESLQALPAIERVQVALQEESAVQV